MMRKFNRLMSLLVAVTIIVSVMPFGLVKADTTFSDFPTGWSKPAMEAAVANGLIAGYDDGTVKPKGLLSRAEMTTVITKAFGAVTTSDISSFTDVKEGSWYYDYIARAVKMGAISGRSTTQMEPDAKITRQEVFSIIARVLVLSNEDISSLSKFADADKIASWAAPSMAALTERGYINGDERVNVNPTDYITREEFAQVMYMAIRTYITIPGTYTDDMDGITVVRVPDVTITGAKISSDLVIADGVGTGRVMIDNTTIEKRLLARGGSIKLNRTTLGENVVVNNVNGITYFDNYKDESVFKGIVENTEAKFKIRVGGGHITPTPTVYTVSYYEGLTDDDTYLLGTSTVDAAGHVVSMPDTSEYGEEGYKETATLASVYDNNESTYTTEASWWYLDNSNTLVEFTNETIVTGDLDVYLLNKKFGLLFVFNSTDLPIMATSAINDETRAIDSVKNLVFSGGKQLETAIALGMMPEYYNKATNKIIEKLEDNGLVEVVGDDKNIQVTNIPFKISQFVKRDVADGMIKQYLRDVVKNPAELDKIFDIINVAEFADQFDINTIISSMSDAEIAAIIKAPENEADITNFILTDLRSTESTMFDFVLNYIITNATFKNKLIGDLIAELKIEAATSTLKTNALTHIMSQLQDDESAFYTKFVDMILADLKSNTSFIMASDEFKSYFLGQFHGSNQLAVKMKELLAENDSEFRDYLLTNVKGNATFLGVLSTIRDSVLDLIRWENFVSNETEEENLLKYVLRQEGGNAYAASFAFITPDDIEPVIASEYNSTYGAGSYESLGEGAKQNIRDIMYANPTVKAAIISNIKSQFNTYKEDLVDDVIAGNPVTDTKANELIDDILAGYIVKFIDGDDLVDDDNKNESIKTAIENILFDFVKLNVIKGESTGNDDLDDELATLMGQNGLREIVGAYIPSLTIADINKYMASFLTASTTNETTVRGELDAFISDANQLATIKPLAKAYIVDTNNESTIKGAISDFINDLDEAFVNTNRTIITAALGNIDVSSFVDEQFIKDYVAGLSDGEKVAFADTIYNALQTNIDYSTFMDGMFNNDKIVVTKSNLSIVLAISSAIRGLDFDTVLNKLTYNESLNKLIDAVGKDYIKQYYDDMLGGFCDGLDAVITEVSESTEPTYSKEYDAVLTLRINVIEVLKKLYDIAQPKVENKLLNADVYYNENIYLKYLVEHDIIGALFDGDESLASGDFTGYKLKDITAYYDYLMSLLFVGDDAITWYGDNLAEEQFDAIYDALIGKVLVVQDKLDEILLHFQATGELPSRLQSLVEKVSQLNSLISQFEPQINDAINKYFSTVDDDKVQTGVDILMGADDPVFTLDVMYDIFYNYDDQMQSKLKELVDSGKLREAIDKFKATSFGELLSENSIESIYDIIVFVSENGIEPYKTAENLMEDVGGVYKYIEDEYTINVGDIEFSVSRFYESPDFLG